MFLQNFGLGELSLILVLVLLLFGPGKLPQVAQSLGNSVRNFKAALQGDNASSSKEPIAPTTPVLDTPPTTPPNAPPA
jgi:sec-independent protein translocase protein TatA